MFVCLFCNDNFFSKKKIFTCQNHQQKNDDAKNKTSLPLSLARLMIIFFLFGWFRKKICKGEVWNVFNPLSECLFDVSTEKNSFCQWSRIVCLFVFFDIWIEFQKKIETRIKSIINDFFPLSLVESRFFCFCFRKWKIGFVFVARRRRCWSSKRKQILIQPTKQTKTHTHRFKNYSVTVFPIFFQNYFSVWIMFFFSFSIFKIHNLKPKTNEKQKQKKSFCLFISLKQNKTKKQWYHYHH